MKTCLITESMACINDDETEGGALTFRWNVPVKDDIMTYGFYNNGNRYWVEISLDGYSSSDIAQLLMHGQAYNRGRGIRDDMFLESIEKAGDLATEEWYDGTVLHAKSSGYGDWECWVDTSDSHGVLGLDNNIKHEIESFCVGLIED